MAEANALVNLITKAADFAQQIAMGLYKTSQAMKLFPVRLAVLREQSNSWTSLLNKYGMNADPFIGPVLELAVQLLDQEELKLQELQQNCCSRVWRRLLLPESLIEALDSVIAAFQTLPEMISQRTERTQQLEKASLYRAAGLPFLPDSKYVPFEASIRKVRTALESETSGPIVLVSGGPGQGKTSMARHLACLYQGGIDPLDTTQGGGGQSQADSKRFVDGVVFLRCGEKADSKSLLLQLWHDLGYQALPTSAGQGQASSAEEIPLALQSEDAMHKHLSARLANQMVLIILDDVWDRMILDRLLVQRQGIKYLITTQVPELWADAISVEIPISLPTSQEANQILANHVKGFPREVTSDIQDQINQIIEKSASNPLVLANVATNIGVGKASQLQEWQSTLRYLSDLQNGDGQRPVILFGRTYSKRTMLASIEMALSSFSSEEQTLLLLASLFESQPVPEVVFKTFFKIVHSSLAKFSRCCEHMETINFIQIESPTDLRSDIPQRSWSLHTMRQNFISLIKKEEIALMFSKLMEYITKDNIVAILLVLYGQESWRNQAASTLGIPVNKYVNDTFKLGSSALSSIRTFVWLLNADGEEEWQKKSHQVTKQILEEYLLLGELNRKNITKLICMKETISGACQALLQFTILNQQPLFKESNDHILHTLMTLLKQPITDSQPQLKEILHLFQDLSFHNPGDAIKIASYSGALERLIGLLAEGVSQDIQNHTAATLGYLSKDVVENATKIGSYPGAVERLVRLLGEGVSPNVQRNTAWALGCLSFHVMENATKIGSYAGAVERLVGLLGEGVSPNVQQNAAWALGRLSFDVVENAAKIGSYPGAMERLVGLLGEGMKGGVQHIIEFQALWYICCGVAENKSYLRRTLLEAPHALESLIVLSCCEKHGDGNLQYWSAHVYEIANNVNGEMVRLYLSSNAYEGKGDALVWMRLYRGALEAYENALAIETGGELVRKRCFVKAKLGDFEGALMDANEYIELGCNRPFGLQERGVLKSIMGDLNGALADLNDGPELEKDDYERLKHRGIVKFLLKDKDGAIADAEWALRIKPPRVESYQYGRSPCLGTSPVEYLGYMLK